MKRARSKALERTQPGRPIKPERCQTMTHDDKRRGTTTLFAALSVLHGAVIDRCMQRHRHVEFICFLDAVARDVAAECGHPGSPTLASLERRIDSPVAGRVL